ncbi:MAG: hypothetical protein HGB04_06500 [Chlorobiaceae bacterium]|nr:hypothetical protein [Chlorobiaceae bacterium]
MIDRIINVAKSWLNTPYHHEGNVKGAGVDCAMLLVEVYAEAGAMGWIEPRPYSKQWMLHRSQEQYLAWVIQYADEVPDHRPGDLVLMRYGRTLSHSAIVIDGTRVIHAYARENCVTWGDLTQEPFMGRELHFYRIRSTVNEG